MVGKWLGKKGEGLRVVGKGGRDKCGKWGRFKVVGKVVKLFTLTSTNDKTRSIGSTFIWQLKRCFQWQAYFSQNVAQSRMHKVRDIWNCEKNNFKDSNFIFNTLIDERNWISQWTRLKKAITSDLKNILNENENNVSPSNQKLKS